MMKTTIHDAFRAAALLALVLILAPRAEASEPTPLFDGKTLDGWVASGDPKAWAVKDGELYLDRPGQGGWLRTDRMYRDFDLTLEFNVPEGGNSGVGLRGSSGGDPAFTGFEVQIFDSHGEGADNRSCGAVYEAIEPTEQAVKAPGEWNIYRIRVVGDVLNVWLNGKHIHADQRLDDRGFFRRESQPLPLNTRATTGYIALQDHGDAVRFRNITITDLSPDPEPAGMVHLIDPELTGWFKEDAGEWTYEQGALVGRNGPGHFFTSGEFTDFELRGLVKTNERGNSGIYVRVTPNPDPNFPWPDGYECQVDHHDPRNFTGVVYDRAKPFAIGGPITRDNAWFDYRIRVEGDRVRTWINGVLFTDAELTNFDRGHIAVQGHHPGNVIMYKDLRVLELD